MKSGKSLRPMLPTSQKEDSKQLTLFNAAPLEEWRPVRDDFNFCRLALFVSSDKKADRFRNIRQTFDVTQGGRTFQVVWEVRHDAELGLPSTFDRDVWLGLMDLIQETTDGGKNPVPDIIEIPSITQFLTRIGKKSDGGKWTMRVKESIKRLCLTTCVTERAFNCPSEGGYLSLSCFRPLHLIEECAFRGDIDGKGNSYESTWIKLGEFVRKNLDSGYIALLDVYFVRTLHSELAKQLYSYLSYRFWLAVQHGRDYTSESWKDLAAYLAASGWDSARRAKERLAPALAELKRTKYIEELSTWSGDDYVFKIGEKFIDELRNRIKARDQYRQWVDGRNRVKQLTVLPRGSANNSVISDEEKRESILMRQAIRLTFCRQTPDAKLLAEHGWTIQDVESMAERLKQNRNLKS